MSTEIELKLQLNPKTARQLLGHPLLASLPAQKLHLLNTYYDTPSLALRDRRIAMRFRKKGWEWLLTVKSAEPASGGLAIRNEWECAATPGTFDFSHVDKAELRTFLDEASANFAPIFTTDFHRQLWHVPYGDSLIELAIDRGTVESQGRSTPICEIELELLSGQVRDIFGLTRELQQQLDLRPAIASKAERGYKLFTNEPDRPFRAKPARITAELTPVAAFRNIALACLEHFQRNEDSLLNGADPEFVHQARVALRRLRSAIKLFAPVLPPEFVAVYGQLWKTLASTLGDARNWDVFLTETLPPIQAAFPDDRDVVRLQKEATRRAAKARKSISALLATSEYPRLLLEFTAAVHALKDTQTVSLSDFANRRIKSRTKSAHKLASQHATLTPSERHQMRICFKKLRYTLDFFEPLLPKKHLKPYMAALARLQEELGLINDQVTAEELINEALSGHPPGVIHGWVLGRHALLIGDSQCILKTWLAENPQD